MTAFEGSQTSSEYLQKRVVTEIIPLLPKPEDDVGSMCVCVCGAQKKAFDSVKLEIQVVVSSLIGWEEEVL